VPNEVRDVLDNKKLWLVAMKDSDHVIDEVSPLGALQAALLAGLGERLAGKARAEHVVLRNFLERNLPDVARGLETEVFLVKSCKVGIEFAGKHTLMTELGKSEVKSAKSGE
jgi:hypothetical protein